MKDIVIGRNTGIRSTTITVPANTVTVICSTDENRTALYVQLADNTTVNVSPDPLTPSATAGILIVQSAHPIDINIQQHGRITTAQWRAFSVAGCHVTVLEANLERNPEE